MSQFSFLSDRNNLLNLDGELKNKSVPRYARKKETSMNISNTTTANMSKLSISYNNSYAILNNTASQNTNNNKKTPDKQGNENAKKSPGK